VILKTTLRYYFFLYNFKLYLTKSKKSYILLINLTPGAKRMKKRAGNDCDGVAEGKVPKSKGDSTERPIGRESSKPYLTYYPIAINFS
jgi:hypothetical protein